MKAVTAMLALGLIVLTSGCGSSDEAPTSEQVNWEKPLAAKGPRSLDDRVDAFKAAIRKLPYEATFTSNWFQEEEQGIVSTVATAKDGTTVRFSYMLIPPDALGPRLANKILDRFYKIEDPNRLRDSGFAGPIGAYVFPHGPVGPKRDRWITMRLNIADRVCLTFTTQRCGI